MKKAKLFFIGLLIALLVSVPAAADAHWGFGGHGGWGGYHGGFHGGYYGGYRGYYGPGYYGGYYRGYYPHWGITRFIGVSDWDGPIRGGLMGTMPDGLT